MHCHPKRLYLAATVERSRRMFRHHERGNKFLGLLADPCGNHHLRDLEQCAPIQFHLPS